MTAEPGTCDMFTSEEPVGPPLGPDGQLTTQETTPFGWILRHTEVGHAGWGPSSYRTEVIHPWRGVMAMFTWSPR